MSHSSTKIKAASISCPVGNTVSFCLIGTLISTAQDENADQTAPNLNYLFLFWFRSYGIVIINVIHFPPVELFATSVLSKYAINKTGSFTQ